MPRPIALVGTLVTMVCIACSTTPNVSKPPVSAPAPAKRDSAAAPPARVWSVRRATGTWRYKVESNATVVLASDSTSPPAPIHSMAIYSLAVDSTRDSGYHITGRVDSSTLSAGGRVPARPVDSTASAFSAQIDSVSGLTNVAMSGGERPTCAGGVTPFVAAGLTLFVSVPSRLQQGAVWHDSTSTTTCRGTVAVVSKLDRTFQLADTTTWKGQSVLRVNVTSTSTIDGQGLASAAGDSIWVSGTGTSSGTLLLDPTSMMPVSSTMTGNSAVTVRSRQTTLPFKQQVADTATMLDHRATTSEP
ncbi:MAG TPA: hypothetical protein VF118_12455 [Gemmatimonadaceae bacterium]